MLEVSYECLESAGLTLDDVSGSNTAVFVGCFTSDYQVSSSQCNESYSVDLANPMCSKCRPLSQTSDTTIALLELMSE
jgi:acyl transferase domain-containing protein